MSNIKKVLFVPFVLMLTGICLGQKIVSWKFSSNKIAEGLYELHFTPRLLQPWHIYSQYSDEGGALPTKFTFKANSIIELKGKVKENGKMISKYEEVFGVTVKYFNEGVSFVQLARLKIKAKTSKLNPVRLKHFICCFIVFITIPVLYIRAD